MLFCILEVVKSGKLLVIVGLVGAGSLVIILAVVGFLLVRLVRQKRYYFYCFSTCI